MTCLCALGMLCFFFLSFFSRSASTVPANEKKERAVKTMSEASNYTGGSDYAANPSSPGGRVSDTWLWWNRHSCPLNIYCCFFLCVDWAHIAVNIFTLYFQPSRPSKKVHNFGKRSNSIRRNPSAPVIKRNWLYKQVLKNIWLPNIHIKSTTLHDEVRDKVGNVL